jgi:hypothetical protein
MASRRTMNAASGVVLEMLFLAGVLSLSVVTPPGAIFALFIVVTELLSTYLVHCPAHYVVGMLLGVRFRAMRLGKTTLARVLPSGLSSASRLIPIVTLETDKESLARSGRTKVAAMYASGTVASVSSAVAIAAVASLAEPVLYSAIAWLVALGYFLFDLLFSPKSGDLYRAKKALRG